MQTVKDEYLQFNLWCRPLSKRNFAFSELKTGYVTNPKSATGALVASLEKAEKVKGSGVLPPQHPSQQDPSTLNMSEEDRVISEARARLESKEDISALPRFRRLKAKMDDKIFDYSEIETAKIQEEIQNVVNRDGYYDEIEPVDADEDYEEKRTINPLAFVVGGLILALVAFLFIYINYIF